MIPLDQWWHNGHSCHIDNHRIVYHDQGSGAPLVLIHGFPTSSWDWAKVWPKLTSHYRCIAIDMLGFGQSDKPQSHDYTLMQQANLHEAVLATLGISQAHFIAHDYGDSVLQELLARQRQGQQKTTVLSAYMLNGGIIPGMHRPRPMQRLLLSPLGFLVGRFSSEARFSRSLAEVFGPNSQPSEEELRGWWQELAANNGPRILHRLIRYMPERQTHRDRWVGVLVDPPAPLRFVAGALDPVSGRHMAEAFAALCPTQGLAILPDVGHYPQSEAPDTVLSDYFQFRRSIAG